MHNRIYTLIVSLIAFVFLNGCGSKGDFSSPFYKTFEIRYDADPSALYLKRTTQKSTEYDSLTYSVYTGKIILPELGGLVAGVDGITVIGSDKVDIYIDLGRRDTMGFLNLTINGDGTKLEGWKGLIVDTRRLPDSVHFTGSITEDKNVKITFGSIPKLVARESYDYYNENNGEIDLPTDTTAIYDTMIELSIMRGDMDSLAFQEMMLDIRENDNMGDLQLQFVAGNLLSLERYSWSEGGAHSLYYWHYFSYNLTTGKRLRLLNVFLPNTLPSVADVINRNLKKKLGLKPEQSLKDAYYNTDRIGVSKNFFVTDRGIGFQYNIYEIASFATGSTTIFVPFQELRGFLSPTFVALISLNQKDE